MNPNEAAGHLDAKSAASLAPEEREKFEWLLRMNLPSWTRRVRGWMPRTGGHLEVADIVHSFITGKLPQLVKHILVASPENEQAYVNTALRQFVIDQWRREVRSERALDAYSAEQQRQGETFHEDQLAISITPDLMRRLTPSRAEALRLFLGVDGPPRSIREIAEALNETRHGARSLVIEGILSVAAALSVQGALSEREVDACYRVLLEGRTVEDAARILGLTSNEVRRALQRARSTVEHSLARSSQHAAGRQKQ